MKLETRYLFFVLALFLFNSFCCSAQENQNKVEFEEILNQLETDYECFFSYEVGILDSVKIIVPPKDLSLEELLNYIEANTPLTVEKIDQRNIVLNRVKLVICGRLLEAESDNPIQYAKIESSIDRTISNDRGEFEIKTYDEIRISHVGFVNTTFKYTTNSKCDDIYLEPSINELEEVVIRPYITEGIAKLNNGKFRIDYQNFGILPGMIENDVLQTIANIPSVSTSNETISNLNIRGGTHDQNLFMLNGMRMFQTGHFLGLISSFSPYFVDEVNINANGVSSEYSGGVSGTVLIETKNKPKEQFSLGLNINMINADVYSTIPIGEKSVLKVSGRRSINQIVKSPTYNNYFEKAFQNSELIDNDGNVIDANNNFFFYDTKVHFKHDFSKDHRLEFNFINSRNKLLFNEYAFVLGTEEFRESSVSQNQIASSLRYYDKINEQIKLSIEGYGTRYIIKSSNTDIILDERLDQKNLVKEIGLKSKVLWPLDSSIQITNGYSFRATSILNNESVNNILISSTDDIIAQNALFSEAKYSSSNKRVNAIIGTRINYFTKINTFRIEPRLTFNYKILKNLRGFIHAELNNQVVSQVIDLQSDFLGVENRKWVLSDNRDHPLIKSAQASIGIDYKKRLFSFGSELFIKEVQGVNTSNYGFQNQLQNSNVIGSYNIKGIEFHAMKSIQDFNLWASYTLSDNKYSFDNFNPSRFRNNLDVRHRINASIGYKKEKFKSSVGLNWNSGLPSTFATNLTDFNNLQYNVPNSDNLSNYLRLDISAKYDFKLRGRYYCSYGISVWNVLNNKNTLNSFYLEDSNNQGVLNEIEGLRRTLNMSLSIFF